MAPKIWRRILETINNELIFRNQNVSVAFVQNICNRLVSVIILALLLMFSCKLCSIVVNLIYFWSYCLVRINLLVKLWKVNIKSSNNYKNNINDKVNSRNHVLYIFTGDRKQIGFFATDQVKNKISTESGCKMSY